MKNIFWIFFVFSSLLSTAQDVIEYKGEKINALDDQGRQTGIWKVYDDAKGIVIVSKFIEGNVVEGPLYYKDSVLIAATKNDKIEIYKAGDTIEAHYHTETQRLPKLVDSAGVELDKEEYEYLTKTVIPMFYGGTSEVNKFIGKNINYKALRGKKGKVTVEFVIDQVGKVSKIKVLESANPKLDEEAMRVVSMLPRWQPGHQNGKFVRIAYALPITFN